MKMKELKLFVAISLVAVMATGAMAAEQTLEERVAALEAGKSVGAEAAVTPSGLPVWLDDVTFYGDLRLRYHFSCISEGVGQENKGRFRLRVGAKKTWLDKRLEAGFRLASGSSSSPTSTNQTFDDNFDEKQVWIDLAYAKYKPESIDGLTIIGGKMKNPFFHTNMIWDSDLNPEGVWAVYECGNLGSIVPFAGFGFFITSENSPGSGDATLHAYQLGATWKIEGIKWTSAVSYYDYGNYAANFASAGGNTVSGGVLSAGEFNVFNLTNKVGFKAFDLPMNVYFDYARNCDSEVPGTKNAYAFGCKVGKNKKQGDWSAAYKLAYIEANATPGGFNDSDFGGANRKGHQWSGKYNLLDAVTTGLKVFYTQPVSGGGGAQFLLLADLIWKF